MRYKEEFIKDVLSKTDIVDIIGEHTKLKEKEGVFFGKDPISRNSKTLIAVYPDKQVFHCFESGKNGNAAAFLMHKKGITMDVAVEELAAKAKIKILPEHEIKQSNAVQKLLKRINEDATKFFEAKLRTPEGKEAMDYFKKRGISDDVIKRFRLGYSPSHGNELYNYLLKKDYSLDLMVQAGLVRVSEHGPYDMFRGRVMFPIINEEQKPIAFGGRVMNDDKPKYLNSPETPIFNKSQTFYGMHDIDNLRRNKVTGKVSFFILCEGYMDVIALHQAGINNAIATLGTAFTRTHIPVINKHTNNLYLTFDSDGAGQKAAMRTIDALEGSGMETKIVNLKPYKDPDEFIKAVGRQEYIERLKHPMDKTDFVAKTIIEGMKKKFLQAEKEKPESERMPDGKYPPELIQNAINEVIDYMITDPERELEITR